MTKQLDGTYIHVEDGVRMKFEEINVSMASKVEKNGGYCPCAVEKIPETLCPCLMFREEVIGEICLCGRFKKVASTVCPEDLRC